MAEQDQSGERTEQPTEKRLRDAREKGDVPRSRELATAAVFGAGVVAILALMPSMARSALGWMGRALTLDPALMSHPQELLGHMGLLMLRLLLAVAPVAAICMAAGIAGPLLIGGLRFSSKSLAPDFKRLSPMAGLKRLYGAEGMAELLRSLLRVALIGAAALLCLKLGLDKLLSLLGLPLEQAARSGLAFTGTLLLATTGALVLLAVIDAPYQKWNHRRKLRMTRQELREEMKEMEGRPEVKARIRQMQHQLSQRQMMESVPTADVIVVNPTHYAVALKYESGRMGAPRVVAKGVDEMALRIREVADAHRVAIVSAPPLARALYREGDIGREIPVRLYAAVAQILSYVYQLRAWRNGDAEHPSAPLIEVDEKADPR
ncbi:MAG TPA: flagellar biosynthesis protein FlhB [Pseudoxanthomonas sp.]|nr:flagellar biosynthesis protein FlhB [Pseudoxanthomonas sp.]